MNTVVALYSDGGVVHRNPSPLAGTWAFRLVDARNNAVQAVSGTYVACGQPGCLMRNVARFPHWPQATVSNNDMEYVAVVLGLEYLPAGWHGSICTDSQITLLRLFPGVHGARFAGLPEEWIHRGFAAKSRLDWARCKPVLLKGHPSKEALARGYVDNVYGSTRKTRQLLVSEHNVQADKACGWQKQLAFARFGETGWWGCTR